MTTYPTALFTREAQIVALGSVIRLYCEVNSIDLRSVVWLKDDTTLVQDVPHIRLRNFTSLHSTTLILVIDNYRRPDAGAYHCAAQRDMEVATGKQLLLQSNGLVNILNVHSFASVAKKIATYHCHCALPLMSLLTENN